MFRRLLVSLPLDRLPDRLRWALLHLAGMPPVMGGEDPPKEDPPKEDPPKEDPPKEDPPKSFSQDEVNRIVEQRLARDRKDRPSDDELAALRDKAKKHDDAEAANQSELDKEKQRADAAEQTAQDATAKAQETLRKAAILTAAAKEGVDADIVHALLQTNNFKVKKDDQELEVIVGDDGQVTGAEDAVKALIEQKSLVGTTPDPGPGDGGPRDRNSDGLTKEQLAEMTPEQIAELDPAKVSEALTG